MAATPVFAQERIMLDAMPDLELYRTTRSPSQTDPDDPQPQRTPKTSGLPGHVDAQGVWETNAMRLEVGGGALRGSSEEPVMGWGRLRLGLRDNPITGLQVRSDLMFAPVEVEEGQWPLQWTGRHRVRGKLGVGASGPVARRSMVLEVDYRLDHGGERPLLVGRADVGPAPFVDESLTLTLWPHLAGDRLMMLAPPLRYRMRRVRYPNSTTPRPLQGTFTQEFSTGITGRIYKTETLEAIFSIADVAWSRTEQELLSTPSESRPKPCGSCGVDGLSAASVGQEPQASQLGSYDRLHVDLIAIELVHDRAEDGVQNAIVLKPVGFGGARPLSGEGGWSSLLFSSELGVSTRRPWGRAGLAFKHEALHQPDVQRLINATRLEGLLEAAPTGGLLGMSAVGSLQSVFDPERKAGGSDPGNNASPDDLARTQAALHSTLFLMPFSGARLGIYHLSSFAPDPIQTSAEWDPWSRPAGRWNHENGIFLRWDLSMASGSHRRALSSTGSRQRRIALPAGAKNSR
ncbi:MAG: hypothetical protein AAFS10_03460 [Myxococcota bacterium]